MSNACPACDGTTRKPVPEVVSVTCEYAFESAHWLPMVADDHKCRRMHGHSYKVAVTVTGEVRPDGMVLDYHDINDVVRPLISKLDHRTLNDIIDNPTCENICMFIWDCISTQIPVSEILVRETDHAYCVYMG
jgi:6-pyruvoyltetrahydropterin/6-carboxytetrahydropterin synthase